MCGHRLGVAQGTKEGSYTTVFQDLERSGGAESGMAAL